eukprot:8354833-Pyramimonas_sp.AAC.2
MRKSTKKLELREGVGHLRALKRMLMNKCKVGDSPPRACMGTCDVTNMVRADEQAATRSVAAIFLMMWWCAGDRLTAASKEEMVVLSGGGGYPTQLVAA